MPGCGRRGMTIEISAEQTAAPIDWAAIAKKPKHHDLEIKKKRAKPVCPYFSLLALPES
jgi:hypothetical protein